MKQTIVVELELADNQKPYNAVESTASGPYEALKHFFEDIKYRLLVIPFASTQHLNPGGSLNGSENRQTALSALIQNDPTAAAAVLWGLRPRTMAKYVGPKHPTIKPKN